MRRCDLPASTYTIGPVRLYEIRAPKWRRMRQLLLGLPIFGIALGCWVVIVGLGTIWMAGSVGIWVQLFLKRLRLEPV